MPLLESGALAVVHPDVLTAGGILETKKIGDLAEAHHTAMAIHMAESPIACMAAGACRGGNAKLHRARSPFGRCSVVGQPCQRVAETAYQKRLYRRSHRSRLGHRVSQRRPHQGKAPRRFSRSLGRHFILGQGMVERPPLVVNRQISQKQKTASFRLAVFFCVNFQSSTILISNFNSLRQIL